MLVGSAYFKDLLYPQNIDVMHTEKNIAKALFGTLFGIDGKSKDNTKVESIWRRYVIGRYKT